MTRVSPFGRRAHHLIGFWYITPWPRRVWVQSWRPSWHRGRGRYVSLGLYVMAFYRGY